MGDIVEVCIAGLVIGMALHYIGFWLGKHYRDCMNVELSVLDWGGSGLYLILCVLLLTDLKAVLYCGIAVGLIFEGFLRGIRRHA